MGVLDRWKQLFRRTVVGEDNLCGRRFVSLCKRVFWSEAESGSVCDRVTMRLSCEFK